MVYHKGGQKMLLSPLLLSNFFLKPDESVLRHAGTLWLSF